MEVVVNTAWAGDWDVTIMMEVGEQRCLVDRVGEDAKR